MSILAEQRRLWSANPRDWAELAEAENRPLYEAMLDAAVDGLGGQLDRPRQLLDLACGSGLLLQLAAARGLGVSGVDITPELLAIAAERVPAADLREGDISALEFADGSFDIATGANAFQFAPDPTAAFTEAVRVLAPGGVLVAASFAEPERNEGTVMHLAMKALTPEAEDQYQPYALSSADGLTTALSEAGLTAIEVTEVPLDWHYADLDTTIRALLASAGGARAAQAAGRDAVVAAITGAAPALTQPDGSVLMRNVFRYAIGVKPA